MKKFFAFLGIALTAVLAAAPDTSALPAVPSTTPAAPLERDLGHGLTYLRLHTLPADLPIAGAKTGTVIVDLRYTRGESEAAAALDRWLKARCSAATPVFVLLNGETAPEVLAWFISHDPLAGLITLGPAGPSFTPDITFKIHPAAERAAYDALEHGTSVETLLTDPTDKPRHDEAAIALERTAPVEESADPGADIANPGEAAAITPTPPRPVIDYVLLRAVQLHHALVALRKTDPAR